jgi:DNA transformation protein and related proteins
MANSKEFVAHVLEMMQPAGRASARAMFGGHGVYVDGLIVGIIVDDVLYLKTDTETRATFIAQQLEPFCYAAKTGELHVTSYYRPPDEALESPDAMREWLRLALSAALRSANRKKPKTPPRKRGK